MHYLAEFSQRRRANIYFPNEQSIFYGVQVNFVNVGRGNLTFTRRDLVTVGRMPLVAARVYDSAGPGSLEFRPGWRLSASEHIEVNEGVATLFSETGAAIRFAGSGNEFVLSPDFPSDHVRLARSASGGLVSHMRTGQTRDYESISGVYRLARVTDRNGNQVRLIYSASALARMENAGHFVELTRNAVGRVTQIRDDQNRRVAYAYDDKGLLAQVTDLGGNLWTYQYTGQDLLHRAVDPDGRENFKVWYMSDRRVQAVDLPSGRISYSYDDATRATTVVDRKSLTSRYFQDAEGVTTRIVNALGEDTEIRLDSRHNVTEIRQNGQSQHQLEYDGEHHLTFRRSFVGGETTAQYQYDPAGHLIQITASGGSQAVFGYDPQGNLLSATDAEGQRAYQYSASGDVSEFHNGEQYLLLGYTADGLVAEAEDEPEYSTTVSYNGSGRPLQASFGNGTDVNMEYDNLGLRRKQDYGSGGKVDYWYDPAGNLTEIKVLNADGSQHGQKLLLDGSYQIVKQTLSNGTEYTLSYDKNGNLTEVRSATSATQFEYDTLNRLTAVVTAQGQRLTYNYAPGERSLVASYDHGASFSAADRRDSGLTFAGYWDVAASRSLASHFGAVRYSEGLGVFQLSGIDGKEVVTSENSIRHPLEKLRLYEYGVPLDVRIRDFQRPSNLMFLPPEYASVNCCPLCNPGDECDPCDPISPTPNINSISPERALRGTTVRVTIEGNSFGPHPTVNAGTGITVTYVSRNDTTIVADFAIATSATAGSRTITVNTPGGPAYTTFFVQVATRVALVSTQNQGQANCAVGMAGWSRNVTLVLRDQASPAQDVQQAAITMADTIQIGSPNQLGISGTVTGSYSTDSGGRWPDTYYVCSSSCPASSGQTNASQSWTANGSSLSYVNAVVYRCSSITVDGQ